MPERTCSVCRRLAAKEELVRFSVCKINESQTAHVVVDYWQLNSGRGVYCHPTANCLLDKKLISNIRRIVVNYSEKTNAKIKIEVPEVVELKMQLLREAKKIRNVISKKFPSKREGKLLQILEKIISSLEDNPLELSCIKQRVRL